MSDLLNKIEDFCKHCGVEDINKFIAACFDFKEILLDENKKYNLTRICENEDFWNKHIADSLSIAASFPKLKHANLRIADVGCGAGFPSLVLAIAFKNLNVTAVDSVQKKTKFVAFAADKLGLRNIDVKWGRARELKVNEEYDCITARAVADPIKIFKETRKWVKKDGKIIIFQTPKTDNASIDMLNKWTEKFGYVWNQTEEFLLPEGGRRMFTYAENKID